MIDLYIAATPNGHKISIAIEELALPYELHPLQLSKNQRSYLVGRMQRKLPKSVT